MAINGFLKLKELLVGWEAKKERKDASGCLSHVAIPEVKVHFLYSLLNFWAFLFLAWDHEYLIPSFLSCFHYSIIGRVTSFLFYLLYLIKLFFRGSPGGARLDFRV